MKSGAGIDMTSLDMSILFKYTIEIDTAQYVITTALMYIVLSLQRIIFWSTCRVMLISDKRCLGMTRLCVKVGSPNVVMCCVNPMILNGLVAIGFERFALTVVGACFYFSAIGVFGLWCCLASSV